MSTLKVDAIRHNSATSDAITTSADGTCTANITSNYSNRSVVYNGAMKIAQRGTSFTGITATGTFPVDRFKFHVGSLGTWTLSQSTDVPTGQGLSHSIKCDVTTANASPSGTAYARIDQRFEGQDLQRFCKGTSNAKNFAVSFWVKSPKTGTHIVQLQDQDNSRNVSKAYTVSSANTWEKKELILPADTTGAFGNDNGGSLFLCFYLAVGPDYQGGTLQTTWGTPVNNTRATGQVNVADSTSNDFYLTGVQMEASSYCSEFEHRSFGEELRRCERYFQCLKGPSLVDTGDNEALYGIAFAYTTSRTLWSFIFKTEMRDHPTIAMNTIANLQGLGVVGGWNAATSLVYNNKSSTLGCRVDLNWSGTPFTAGHAVEMRIVSDGLLSFDAEL